MGGEGRNGGKWSGGWRQNWGTYVYGDTLPSEPTRSADAVNVILTISGHQGGNSKVQSHKTITRIHVRREVVVNHEGDLLHINPAGPHIRGDQHTAVEEWKWRRWSDEISQGPGKDGVFKNITYEVPPRNSAMMASLSFCTISPCIAETVKFAVRIFSVNQST